MKQTANAAYMIFSFKERIHDEQKRKEKKAQVFKIREKTEDGMTRKNLQGLKFGGGKYNDGFVRPVRAVLCILHAPTAVSSCSIPGK